MGRGDRTSRGGPGLKGGPPGGNRRSSAAAPAGGDTAGPSPAFPGGKLAGVATALLLLGAAVLGSYANAFRGEFVWDDVHLVVENPYVKSPRHLATLLVKDFWDLGETHDRFRSFYRPLVSLSYMLDHAAWKLKPAGFHLTNVYAHFLASFFAFLFMRRLQGSTPLALAASVLFALHPVHVESVAWISGRTDVLCALFLFASLWLYLASEDPPAGRARRDRARCGTRILSVAAFALSLAAKEMSLTLPLLLVLLDLARTPGSPVLRLVRARARAYLPYLAVLAAYLAIRLAVLGTLATNPVGPAPLALALSIVHVLARYLGLLALPVALDSHHPDGFVEAPTLAWGVEAAGVVALAVIAVVLFRRRSPFFLPAAWIGLTLPPVLNLGGFGDVILAERFLYVPSLGLCLLLARLFAVGSGDPPAGRVRSALAGTILVLLAAFFGIRTWTRTHVWLDNVALFSAAARTSPDSAYVLTNLGIALSKAGRTREAVEHYERAIAIAPASSLAHNNLGVAMEEMGRIEEARRHHERAIALAPGDPMSYFNLGNVAKREGNCRGAIRWYEAALARKPGYGEALTNMGGCWLALDDPERAAAVLSKALALDPTLEKAWNNLGTVHYRLGDFAAAERALARAARLVDPSVNPRPLANHAEALSRLGRAAEAEAEFRRVLGTAPGLPVAVEGLARLLLRTARPSEAVSLLEEAGRAHPGTRDASATFLLGQAYEEAGRGAEAVAVYRSLLARETLGAEDRRRVEERIERLGGVQPSRPDHAPSSPPRSTSRNQEEGSTKEISSRSRRSRRTLFRSAACASPPPGHR